jgi:hypothetical protein
MFPPPVTGALLECDQGANHDIPDISSCICNMREFAEGSGRPDGFWSGGRQAPQDVLQAAPPSLDHRIREAHLDLGEHAAK